MSAPKLYGSISISESDLTKINGTARLNNKIERPGGRQGCDGKARQRH